MVRIFLLQLLIIPFIVLIKSVGAIAVTNGLFSDLDLMPGIGDVQCSGTESELLECAYSTTPISSCRETDDAGVVCQGMANVLLHEGKMVCAHSLYKFGKQSVVYCGPNSCQAVQ